MSVEKPTGSAFFRREDDESSEPYDSPGGDLDLLQGALTETERVAEVAGIFVVQDRRRISDVSTEADRFPRKVLDSAAETE